VRPIGALVGDLLTRIVKAGPAPVVLALDGRSGGGKSWLAERFHAHLASSVGVHTDDVAWHHSFFG